jgi:hypothetical protein
MLFLSTQVFSVEFNSYCPFNKGGQDCSAEFLQAMTDMSENGGSLILNAGEVFHIQDVDTEGLQLSNIKIIGVSANEKQPIIFTDRLFLLDVNNLSISNVHFKGINFEEGDTQQGNAIIVMGSKDELKKVSNIQFINNYIEDGAEDLLSIWNAMNIQISNNIFKRSGLAMRIAPIMTPGDLRPRGSGLLFLNVENVLVNSNEFYAMKKIGIYLDGKEIGSWNVDIIDNYIDLESFEKPTYRYGLLGGAGIYLTNTPNIHKVNIMGNRILNYKGNGMRLNGSEIIVKNNHLNYKGLCKDKDNILEHAYLGTAFKGHYLTNSTIENNCVKNSNAGISLESWGEVSSVKINKNIMHNATNAIYVITVNEGTYENISINRNELYGTKNYGIAFRSAKTSYNNKITSNTIANANTPMDGPLISLQRQNNLYYANNWIMGQAQSINWNHLRLDKVSNSTFKNSVFKSYNGVDRDFGGIYNRDLGSENNRFDNINFQNLTPGIKDLGINNSISNTTYD